MASNRRPAGFSVAIVALVSALALVPDVSLAAPTKNILIVRGEAPDLPAPTIIVDAIMSTVRREFATPVEFYSETIDTTRFPSAEYDRRLADLYLAKYSGLRLDLVIAFTEPAVDFAIRERGRLFPHAPLLFGMIEPRFVYASKVPDDASLVFVQVDAAATLRLALATYPATKRVVVIGGTSRFDRGWQPIVRDELRSFAPQVSIEYDTDSPLDDLIKRVSRLPLDAIVLYVSITRDGANVPMRPPEVVERLRSVSRVPIYGLSTTYLGRGIVGGALLDHAAHGTDLGRRAIRMLRGDSPPPMTTPATTAVDWREMQRFNMDAGRLPPGTLVLNREPGVWERSKVPILVMGFVVALEGGLIFALVRLTRRRREAQQQVSERLRFEMVVTNLALSLTAVTPGQIGDALEAALNRVAAEIGLAAIWRWRFGDPADSAWDSPQLRTGRAVFFGGAAELPPSIQEKLRARDYGACSVHAIPMATGGLASGALMCVSGATDGNWRVGTDQLQMVATIVSNVLQRRHAESALEKGDRLKGAILDSLPAHVAVLDREGTIISTNDAWMAFGPANGLTSDSSIGVGASYLRACIEGARARCPGAREALSSIQAACRGERTGQQIEYRCDSPVAERWFLMTVEPLRRAEGGAVVTHSDITTRKFNEIALRESEDRFRRLADALPVAIWMSETDTGCSYFNKQWLEMTGRTLEQEIGDGWLEGVHPDDRAECLDAYLHAFGGRRRFTINYRIRDHDGQYKWLMDVGMPRYGSDGAFHGYIGGCIDITERMESEQVLRELNRRLIGAQEEERRRIARELHDHLNQQVALLAITLQRLSMSPPESPEALTSSLQEAWRRTTEIASDVHGLSHRLHPSKLEALGLVATIRAHCRDVSRQNLAAHFLEQSVPPRIPPDVALCLFRVLEEALSNVASHSGATEAHVTLLESGPDIVLRVADAGRGFEPAKRTGGLGLVSMRERLQALGGVLTITSAPGMGTIVEARVRCDEAWQKSAAKAAS